LRLAERFLAQNVEVQRPVIGVLRLMPMKVNCPLRLLVALLR
jgi:hypothetical protein